MKLLPKDQERYKVELRIAKMMDYRAGGIKHVEAVERKYSALHVVLLDLDRVRVNADYFTEPKSPNFWQRFKGML